MATYFTVNGVRYERVDPDDWTFAEGHEFQRIAGMAVGMGLIALQEMNVDAHMASMVVSMKRTDPTITEHAFADLKIGDVIGSFEQIEEAADPEPNPPIAPPSNGGGSGADTSAIQQTLEPSGTQHGSGT